MSEEEWGPWIDHDGKGCPVPIGTVVNVVRRNRTEDVFAVGRRSTRDGSWTKVTRLPLTNNAWIHGSALTGWAKEKEVIKYRVKKPKGLQILESLLQNLDDKINIDRPLEIQT